MKLKKLEDLDNLEEQEELDQLVELEHQLEIMNEWEREDVVNFKLLFTMEDQSTNEQ